MPWLDAAWHPAGPVAAPIPFDPSDRGLLLGDGVFDTALVLCGRMVFRAAHLARLARHAAVLGVDVEPARLAAAADGALAELAGGPGALRITLTRGPGRRGLAPPSEPRPTILATVAAGLPPSLLAPATLHPTAIRRNASSPLSKVKSLCYGDAVLAAAEAVAAGCDDAMVLNEAGRIAGAGAGNLFALIGDALVTPPPSEGALDGIVRALLLDAAPGLGLRPDQRPLRLDEAMTADAVLLTNSLRLVSQVTAIGGCGLRRDPRVAALVAALAAGDAALRDVVARGAPEAPPPAMPG